MSVISRAVAVQESAASLRLEGLTSSPAVDELLDAWARDELSDEDLVAAEQQLLAGQTIMVATQAA